MPSFGRGKRESRENAVGRGDGRLINFDDCP
jgi:hypothetical protein